MSSDHFKKDNIKFILGLLSEISIKATTKQLLDWCEGQKKYWKGQYARLKS